MKLLTREQSRYLDDVATNDRNIPGRDLMNSAGNALAELINDLPGKPKDKKTAVICGKGNNGGDGFAAALALKKFDISADIFLLADKKSIDGDSLYFFKNCEKEMIPILAASLLPETGQYKIIIDAYLGTGFSGELQLDIKKWFQWLNNEDATIISADIPSGVNANTGECADDAVIADYTVTMGEMKIGMALEPGRNYTGEIIVADIGFPEDIELKGITWEEIEPDKIRSLLMPPHFDTNKFRQGKVLIIGGSKGMTGAAILSSRAALRSGAGVVKSIVPESLNTIFETHLLEVMTCPVMDNGCGYLGLNNYFEIQPYLDWCDSLVIGPGIGLQKETGELIHKILSNFSKPAIIDADALSFYNFSKENHILTPHEGEFARIYGAGEIGNKFEQIDSFMGDFKGVLVYKNAPSFTVRGTNGIVNTSGNAGLATAGSGDVLSGIIAAFVAQGQDLYDAASIAVYIHGYAADIILDKLGFRGIIASDIVEALPYAISEFELSNI